MNKPTTFQELTEEYLNSPQFLVLSPISKDRYRDSIKILIRMGSQTPVAYAYDELSRDRGLDWYKALTVLDDGTASNYKKNYLRQMLGAVYAWGIRHLGVFPMDNPVTHIPRERHEVKEFSPFTPKDIDKITTMQQRSVNKLSRKDSWTAVVVKFLFETGMRPSELRALNVEDLITEDGEKFIQILGSKAREQGKVSRYIYATPTILNLLRYMEQFRTKNNAMIPFHTGSRLGVKSLQMAFKELMNRAGIVGKTLYDLRRGCATEIINNPAYGITVAMKQLGHKNISTTMVYETLNKKRAAMLFKGHTTKQGV